MAGDGFDVVLHELDVLEDIVIHSLKDIIGRRARRLDLVCIVDKSVSQGFDSEDLTFYGKMRSNFIKRFHKWSLISCNLRQSCELCKTWGENGD